MIHAQLWLLKGVSCQNNIKLWCYTEEISLLVSYNIRHWDKFFGVTLKTFMGFGNTCQAVIKENE